MSSTDRQNRLIVAEDWKKIYQSYKNADFKSYDFDNLRRVMITYLRENYPEDFNDYIESSEYLALIDLIAFLGQNISFRFDLNARDNLPDLSERRESVLRFARLLSYNAKRNIPASGLLKFNSVQTTEAVFDSNGRDLSSQTIVWNDTSNSNWYDQFIKVINAALPANSQFGKPIDTNVISGVPSDQYRFNSTNSGLPVYSFTKNIDGRNTVFEIVSGSFYQSDSIFEEPPLEGNSLAFMYRDDGRGSASTNTGFFLYFRQGTLQTGEFLLDRPTTNQTVSLDAVNINNDDVWLYKLDESGLESELWTKVNSVEGNNIIYNSLKKSIRKIFAVLTKSSDRADLIFSDGVFGELPQGNFKVYYRTSNNQSYVINPKDIKNVSIDIPYISAANTQETLTINVGLRYTINNAAASESSESIKLNAPATYYTQGRMITGEDYNILPLSINQEIVKIKSVNRVSSGISRYFDLTDTTGKYSHTNLFGIDGIIYRENQEKSTTFTYQTKTDIEGIILNEIEPLILEQGLQDFYFEKYPRIVFNNVSYIAINVTSGTLNSTGYISTGINSDALNLGTYTNSEYLKYIKPNSLVKFEVQPVVAGTFVPGYTYTITTIGTTDFTVIGAFSNTIGTTFIATGQGTGTGTAKFGTDQYIWAKVVNISGNGAGIDNTGKILSGTGAVTFDVVVPTNSLIKEVIPKFTLSFDSTLKARMNDLIYANAEFGIRYDWTDSSWRIVTKDNLNKISDFSVAFAGDVTNQQKDSSWLLMLETNGDVYSVTYRTTRYVFESEKEIRFFYDPVEKIYDTKTGEIISDRISVLSINPKPDATEMLGVDYVWKIIGEYKGIDGYIDTKKITVSFYDSDFDGLAENPDLFDIIVSPTVNPVAKYVFQKKSVGLDNSIDYYYVKNDNNLILVYETIDDIVLESLINGQLVYIIDQNLVKQYNKSTETFTINTEYRGFIGRDNIKFHYNHAASSASRLDPSATNIMDIYILTKSYDFDYRRWLNGNLNSIPKPMTSDKLYTSFSDPLNQIKATSDEIIYHPVKYKNLFGSSADKSLQAKFKVIKNTNVTISDNDIKSAVINAIDEFFAIENWDFGDTFYFSELSTYIMNKIAPNITSIIIVPVDESLSYGNLQEIKSNADEIFISSADVVDVEIINEITDTVLRIKSDN